MSGKWLVFDTSGDTLIAGLFQNDRVIVEKRATSFSRHSDTLVPFLAGMLKDARVSFNDLEGVAVGLGPGSFTGLRVGVTTAKVIAFSLGKKLVGISSLEALASASEGDGDVAVALDARRGQAYAARYRKTGQALKVLTRPHLAPLQDFIRKNIKDRIVQDTGAASASSLYASARPAIRAGRFADPAKLQPLYLYARDCNVTKPKKRK